MREGWKPFKVGDLLDLKPGFAFKSRDFKKEGVPIIKIKNVKAGEVQLSTLSYVDPEFVDTHERYRINVGELLITLSGNRSDGSKETWVGKVAQFRLSGDYLLNQRVAVLSEKPDAEIDMRFMGYLLGSDSFQHLFIAIATSSGGQANLSSAQVLGADLLLPPLSEQRAIASILGALDDKIELNRRMNGTLESLARAIFKSWFVDFDPVKINAGQMPASSQARATHHPKVLDLFPSTFQDSELGPIPEGWEPQTLESVLELAYGKALKKSDRIAGEFPVYGSGGLTGTHNKSLVDGPGVIVGRKGSVGTIYWEESAFYPIDTVFYVKPRDGYSLPYLYYLLQTLGLEDMNTDAAVPGLNRNNAYRLEIVKAPDDVRDQFNRVAGSLHDQIAGNNADTEALTALRDTLLPELLAGQLQIPAELLEEMQ